MRIIGQRSERSGAKLGSATLSSDDELSLATVLLYLDSLNMPTNSTDVSYWAKQILHLPEQPSTKWGRRFLQKMQAQGVLTARKTKELSFGSGCSRECGVGLHANGSHIP